MEKSTHHYALQIWICPHQIISLEPRKKGITVHCYELAYFRFLRSPAPALVDPSGLVGAGATTGMGAGGGGGGGVGVSGKGRGRICFNRLFL